MKLVKYFLATAAVAALTGCLGDGNEPLAVAAAPAPTGPIQLQILSINDFEGRLEPVIVGGRPAGGAAVLASYLNEWERRATARGATTIRVQAGVTSRTIIWAFMEQIRARSVPFFHGLHRRFALQR